MFASDNNDVARLERFTRDYEIVAAVHDCVTSANCPADSIVDEIEELLNGVEFQPEYGYEILYSALFATPAINSHMENLDLTASEMVDAIYESDDAAALGQRIANNA